MNPVVNPGAISATSGPELAKGRIHRRLNLGSALRTERRYGERGGSEAEESRSDTHLASGSIHHYPPSFHEKLYLNENWILNPSLWKPSVKFSRRPHCSSAPIITFGTGV